LPHLRIHDLRHSFASALVNEGVPLFDVQELLGHSSIKTTQRYAHLSKERLQASARRIDDVYG
jgi:site-specific recombinase XerD